MVLLWTSIGSLIIILLVTWLVRGLKLGEVRLQTADEARQWAEDQIPGFHGGDVILDQEGQSALVAELGGERLALIKRQGAHFTVRPVLRGVSARRQGTAICVDSGESQFGTLNIVPAQQGADRLLTMM